LDHRRLKDLLDNLYNTFDFKTYVLHDPIEFPHRYSERGDIEASGFLASAFAYGRVNLFKPVVDKILSIMGKSPAGFLLNYNPGKDASRFSGIKYRFNDTEDILCLIQALSSVLRNFGSFEKCFLQFSDEGGISSSITGFAHYMKASDGISARPDSRQACKRKGFLQFIPSPDRKSPCKRMNLYLRWMVRDRDIDFGIWREIPKKSLIIPLDTHIARISRCFGLTKRRSQDWKMAEDITESLKRLDPEDPLKYDFALCHQGIMGICREEICRRSLSSCQILGRLR
jgi:uncharacterized protein (TIGR02757 family)